MKIAFDELQRYKVEKRDAVSVDPLHWWKLNEYSHSKLPLFSKTMPCVPATLVP